ncbi:MAG: magnesium-translocating P-type ATPase [Hydrogenothermaceae bacterium]|nr:magnesium-translocating P-type ATPase [Hydrogenothermaceae bacterium]
MEYKGLSSIEAQNKLKQYGYNKIKNYHKLTDIDIFINQFKNPYLLLLLFTAFLSLFLGEKIDAVIIIFIVLIGVVLDFWQERTAYKTVEKLLSMVKTYATAIRDGKEIEIPIEEVVPEDIIVLNAGDIVPADMILLESKDLFINESLLTGEPYPVEKKSSDKLFMGTHVVSGFGVAKVEKTGENTQYGQLIKRVELGKEETDFERGLRHFGYSLLEIATILILIVFTINAYFNRGIIESLLFSLSLGIGIAPVLLPAVVSIGLSYGAKHMARKGAIVKRLVSIENFGSMDILCTDKTGTLTLGQMKVYSYIDITDKENERLHIYACLNAIFQTGYENPIDEAIKSTCDKNLSSSYKKLDEIPYDFNRKRLSILIKEEDKNIVITKGAYKEVLGICKYVEVENEIKPIEYFKEQIENLYFRYSKEGFKIIVLAYKETEKDSLAYADENSMILLGFIILFDPLREDAKETIERLKNYGVNVKIITGDNRLVALHIAKSLGIGEKILTGEELSKLNSGALLNIIKDITIFAELTPLQKETVVHYLKKAGFTVGYMGDGINDIAAMRASDVAISVQNAVDIAKETADIVMTSYNLNLIADAILEGRKTFLNTLKYIFMQTSSNFGNVFSMAGASLIVPFLPLLPKQVLTINMLSDTAVMSIPADSVDKDWIEKPVKWNLDFIKKFMFIFGLISSLYDYITFTFLLYILKADTYIFRSGWFLESILTQLAVLLVLRTRKPFYKSKPSKLLIITVSAIFVVSFILPYTPIGKLLELYPLNIETYIFVFCVIISYVITVEIGKFLFYRKIISK